MPREDSNGFMSVAELADYLSIPKNSVYERWRSWGLRGYKVGKHLRFHTEDVEQWLEGNTVH